jgi:hypothetical protein
MPKLFGMDGTLLEICDTLILVSLGTSLPSIADDCVDGVMDVVLLLCV